MTKIKQTDGKHNGVTVFCPVNGWNCPYWGKGNICYFHNPMICPDFKLIFENWEYWEAL